MFTLGGVAIYLSRYVLPEAPFPWLSVVSGLLMVYTRRVFERHTFEARILRYLPVVSAAAISFVGFVILLGAIGQTGLI